MKNNLRKNLKLRRAIFNNETKLLFSQFLINSKHIKAIEGAHRNLTFLNFFHAFLAKNSRAKVHNFCIYTGRSRGIVRFFNMSRLLLRQQFSKRQILGLKSKIW